MRDVPLQPKLQLLQMFSRLGVTGRMIADVVQEFRGKNGPSFDGTTPKTERFPQLNGLYLISYQDDRRHLQMTPPLALMTWPLIHDPSDPARKDTALAMSSG